MSPSIRQKRRLINQSPDTSDADDRLVCCVEKRANNTTNRKAVAAVVSRLSLSRRWWMLRHLCWESRDSVPVPSDAVPRTMDCFANEFDNLPTFVILLLSGALAATIDRSTILPRRCEESEKWSEKFVEFLPYRAAAAPTTMGCSF